MPDLFDPTDEVDDLLLTVIRKGGTTAEQGDRFYKLVMDAIQAHRPWAPALLESIIKSGSQTVLKRHVTARCIVHAKTRGGRKEVPVATVVGVKRKGDWNRVPMFDLTPIEFQEHVATKIATRNRATERLEPLRRLKAVVDLHPSAATVGEALKLAGTTVADVLERAS